jgi:hypothetical protein
MDLHGHPTRADETLIEIFVTLTTYSVLALPFSFHPHWNSLAFGYRIPIELREGELTIEAERIYRGQMV